MAAPRHSIDNEGLARLRRMSFVDERNPQEKTRSQYIGLQQLTIPSFNSSCRHPSEGGYDGDVEQSPFSVMSCSSPTFNGVGHCFLDNGRRRMVENEKQLQRLGALAMKSFPRRQSEILTPGGLTTQFESIAVSSTSRSLQNRGTVFHRKSIMGESRSILLSGVDRNELERLGSCLRGKSAYQAKSAPRGSSMTPRKTSHDLLREWGHTYLGNIATADVFVRSVHLRSLTKGSIGNTLIADRTSRTVGGSMGDSQQLVLRARVTPLAKERQPFLIQRRFNLQDFRATSSSQSDLKEPADRKDFEPPLGSKVKNWSTRGRSKSSPSVGQSQRLHAGSSASRKPSLSPAVSTSRHVMPIHVEYALRYLPVLGALLLSGHVRRGDTVDLPMPRPEAWRDVVCYIYTGRGGVTDSMKENICYLAGWAT